MKCVLVFGTIDLHNLCNLQISRDVEIFFYLIDMQGLKCVLVFGTIDLFI